MSLEYIKKLKLVVDETIEVGLDRAASIFWKHLGEGTELPVHKHSYGVLSAPVLTDEEAQYFKSVALLTKEQFQPNEDEEAAYQIPELILSGRPLIVANQILQERLLPIFHVFFGVSPAKIVSAQLAWYTPDGVQGTCWHTDEDSDMTCVISLDPSMFTGGGTAIRPYGPCDVDVVVPPVPKGHGLFFNGKYMFHKGLPVLTGDRILLVYWLSTEDESITGSAATPS